MWSKDPRKVIPRVSLYVISMTHVVKHHQLVEDLLIPMYVIANQKYESAVFLRTLGHPS